MKKITALVLAMVLAFATMAGTTAFAAEANSVNVYGPVEENNASICTVYGSNTHSGIMVGGQTVQFVAQNVGINPSFDFSISGNPHMYVTISAVSPLGNTFTLFDRVCCDGTVYHTSHFSLISGDYNITIFLSGGATSGQRKPYQLDVSW